MAASDLPDAAVPPGTTIHHGIVSSDGPAIWLEGPPPGWIEVAEVPIGAVVDEVQLGPTIPAEVMAVLRNMNLGYPDVGLALIAVRVLHAYRPSVLAEVGAALRDALQSEQDRRDQLGRTADGDLLEVCKRVVHETVGNIGRARQPAESDSPVPVSKGTDNARSGRDGDLSGPQ